MKKKPEWTFPDLPPFLAGLTLEHLSRLRVLVRRHGMLVGLSPHGEVHSLKVREPVAAFLIVIGSAADAALIVAPPEGLDADGNAAIALVPGGGTAVDWSPKVPLADVLLCLDADAVVKTSQLDQSKKDGTN